MKNRINKILSELKSLFILIVIILTIKVTIFEMYIVPTGSMENTIMTGDFLVGNRFVYGMNTPDRVGVMDLALNIPSLKFPSFKEPRRGDVIIFKFPRDVRQKYVKRCVAEPGDILEIRDKVVHINDQPFPLANNGKFVIANMLSESFSQNDIFKSHRQKFHNFYREHSGLHPSRTRMKSFSYVMVLIWLFFAVGPGLVLGNDLFGSPGAGYEGWALKIPSIWGYQLTWWFVGIALLWFLANKMDLSTLP